MGKSMWESCITVITCITKVVTCITKMGSMRSEMVRGSITMMTITISGRDSLNSGRGSDGVGSICDRGNSNGCLGYDGGGNGFNMVSLVVGDRGSKLVGISLDLVVRSGEGGFGLNKGFLGKDGSGFNDGMGDMFGGSDGSGDNFGNGSGFMDMGGLSNRVGQS